MVGKGDIAHYEQFLLFPNVFKSCLLLMRQNVYLWCEGLRQFWEIDYRILNEICLKKD